MKAATGELNLTVITVVAIGLVAALFVALYNGPIKKSITNQWGDTEQKATDANGTLPG